VRPTGPGARSIISSAYVGRARNATRPFGEPTDQGRNESVKRDGIERKQYAKLRGMRELSKVLTANFGTSREKTLGVPNKRDLLPEDCSWGSHTGQN
jgi:hypothetical protein